MEKEFIKRQCRYQQNNGLFLLEIIQINIVYDFRFWISIIIDKKICISVCKTGLVLVNS